jgi:hypothetical protein
MGMAGSGPAKLTAAAARFAEHLALKLSLNLSDLFRINAAIGGCFVLGFGYHRFSTGRRIAADEAWLSRVSSSR